MVCAISFCCLWISTCSGTICLHEHFQSSHPPHDSGVSSLLYRWVNWGAERLNNWPEVSLVVQMVKNLLAIWETWVWSLGREDPLEEGMATHSSILAWRIPMDRGAWRATGGRQESDMTEWLSTAQRPDRTSCGHFSIAKFNKLCYIFASTHTPPTSKLKNKKERKK